MYEQKYIKQQTLQETCMGKLMGSTGAGLGGSSIPQPPQQSEVQCELNMLHNAVGHLRNLHEEINVRVRTVSLPQATTADGTGQACQGGPSSEVAQGIAGARWQIESIAAAMRETIERLCV